MEETGVITTQMTYLNSELSSRVIAVALDDSFGARDAFMWAISNVRIERDTLHLIHCIPDPADYAVFDDEGVGAGICRTEINDEVMANSEDDNVLRSYKAYCTDRGIKCTVRQVAGDPTLVVDALLPATEVKKCDLIVVGSAGKSRVERTLLGSTSESTVHNAHCPVVVVKSDHVARSLSESVEEGAPPNPRVVCIGLDNTKQSQYAFSWVVDNYLRTTDQVWLVHVQTDIPDVIESVTDEVSEQLKQLSSVLTSANIPGHHAMRLVSSEDVSVALLNAVRNVGATTLVVGCRGRGYFKRVFFGSVSDGVVRNATCDVIVVKEATSDDDDDDIPVEEAPPSSSTSAAVVE